MERLVSASSMTTHRLHFLTFLVLLDFLLLICGYAVTQACSIESKSWDFQGHFIGYEVANPKESSEEPILLLNGFGVGSFHQHRLIATDLHRVGGDESRFCSAIRLYTVVLAWSKYGLSKFAC